MRLVVDGAHYDVVIDAMIRSAKTSVWIATANVKDVRVEAPVGTAARARGRYMPLVDVLASLARSGVEVRLLHGGLPSGPFRASRKGASAAIAMRRCPRVHMKLVVVDGREMYLGSANLTGAGLGAKGEGRRNFELGAVVGDDVLLDAAQARFDRIWSGAECSGCAIRALCPKPIDALVAAPSRAKRAPGRAARQSPSESGGGARLEGPRGRRVRTQE